MTVLAKGGDSGNIASPKFSRSSLSSPPKRRRSMFDFTSTPIGGNKNEWLHENDDNDAIDSNEEGRGHKSSFYNFPVKMTSQQRRKSCPSLVKATWKESKAPETFGRALRELEEDEVGSVNFANLSSDQLLVEGVESKATETFGRTHNM